MQQAPKHNLKIMESKQTRRLKRIELVVQIGGWLAAIMLLFRVGTWTPVMACFCLQWLTAILHLLLDERRDLRPDWKSWLLCWGLTFVMWILSIWLADILPRPSEQSFGDGWVPGMNWLEILILFIIPPWLLVLIIWHLFILARSAVRVPPDETPEKSPAK